MKTVLLGAGTLGIAVARRLDGPVVAVTASPARHPELRALGADPTTAWPAVETDDRWVLALPGSDAQAEAIRRLAATAPPRRVVLVGTTAWHAPYDGRIGPDSPSGQGVRAEAAIRAESCFRAWAPDGVVVRCGGLWHEGRGPAAAFARTRSAPLGPPDAPLPLVHYDEAAALVVAALDAEDAPPVVLAVTATPTRRMFYEALCAELGCELPAFAPATGRSAWFEDPWAAAHLPR